jgi:hypothetical protein
MDAVDCVRDVLGLKAMTGIQNHQVQHTAQKTALASNSFAETSLST